MAEPSVDSRWRYAADVGLAARHVDAALPGEMADLDLHPDTEVTVVGVDDERGGLVLVAWTDRSGNPRTTSVEPATFADHFTEA